MRGDNKSGVGGISNRQLRVSFPPQRRKSTTSTKLGAYVWRAKNRPIVRRTVLQSGGESSKPSTMAAAKNLKDSDFVTCVRRREDLKSAKESSHPSGTAEENMVNGSDLKLEISRKHISREKTGSRLQKLIRNGGRAQRLPSRVHTYGRQKIGRSTVGRFSNRGVKT